MVVAQRQRGNPLGWLFLLTGIILLISNDADRIISRTLAYAIVTGLRRSAGHPGTRARLTLASRTWMTQPAQCGSGPSGQPHQPRSADGGAEQVPDTVGKGQADRSADDHPQDGAADVAAA